MVTVARWCPAGFPTSVALCSFEPVSVDVLLTVGRLSVVVCLTVGRVSVVACAVRPLFVQMWSVVKHARRRRSDCSILPRYGCGVDNDCV